MDHDEDIDKEIRISLSIFWDIAVQGGNEVMRYLSNSFIYSALQAKEVFSYDSAKNLVGYSNVRIKIITSLCTATEAYSTEFSSLSRKACSKKSQCKRALKGVV